MDELLKDLFKAVLVHFKRNPVDLMLFVLLLALSLPIWHYTGLSPEEQARFLERVGTFAIVMVALAATMVLFRYATIYFWRGTRHFPIVFNSIEFYTEVTQIPFTGYDPSWSRTGKRFVYSAAARGREGTDIFIGDNSLLNEAVSTSSQQKGRPSFSFDDRYIAFQTESELYVIDHGEESAEWRLSPEGFQLAAYEYDWSPREHKIACGLKRVEEQVSDLWILDVTDERGTYNLSLGRLWFGDRYREGGSIHARWSPSGDRIGITLGGGGLHDMWVAEVATGELKHVTLPGSRKRSYDGKYENVEGETLSFQSTFEWLSDDEIVFCYGGAGMYTIASHRIGGSISDKSPSGYYFDPLPCRSSGKMIYFRDSEAILVDRKGRNPMKVFDTRNQQSSLNAPTRYSWHPSGKYLLAGIANEMYRVRIPRSIRLYVNSQRLNEQAYPLAEADSQPEKHG